MTGARPGQLAGYRLGPAIGTGTFSQVLLGTHLAAGQSVAIKVISKDSLTTPEDHQRLAREMDILRQVRHPYVL